MLTSDFHYELPPELIASEPLPDRADSRLMVVHRATGVIEHRLFRELPQFVEAGDLWVFNNTRVVPARFVFKAPKREMLRVEELTPRHWRCLVKPGKKFFLGAKVIVGEAIGRVIAIEENGQRVIEWDREVDMQTHGQMPLPQYMHREAAPQDSERYQTVFAKHDGSIAAPTAGLHFTPELVATLPHTFVTLHVGMGTFQPVQAERVADHVMHTERYEISQDAADQVAKAKRVIAVGTTACRTLESSAREHGKVTASAGKTDIFIYPGFEFKAVQALVTNFHLPRSTLLMLVSAFAGRELMLHAYAEAVRERYRFFSYGDCMLLL